LEIEDWEMNTYIAQELDLLIDTAFMGIDIEFDSHVIGTLTFIEISGRRVPITCESFITLVFKPYLFDATKSSRDTKKLYQFIHYTPFENVPLHINDIPVVAKWRLEIGK
jgi:hypothetical protein